MICPYGGDRAHPTEPARSITGIRAEPERPHWPIGSDYTRDYRVVRRGARRCVRRPTQLHDSRYSSSASGPRPEAVEDVAECCGRKRSSSEKHDPSRRVPPRATLGTRLPHPPPSTTRIVPVGFGLLHTPEGNPRHRHATPTRSRLATTETATSQAPLRLVQYAALMDRKRTPSGFPEERLGGSLLGGLGTTSTAPSSSGRRVSAAFGTSSSAGVYRLVRWCWWSWWR